YDYIIVGGGTAGCVLANRLTADEGKKVLVLEAGSSDYKNTLVRIPAGIVKLFQTKFDWIFNSAAEANVNNREIYLCRGKLLGGSSSLNVLLYHRGDAKDYDKWAEIADDGSWGPDKVLPYFKKSEDDFRGESAYHGTGGELSVNQVQYQNPLSMTYLNACKEAGFPANDDFNDWSRPQEGYGRYQVTEKDGARCSAASGFLHPVLKRKNLDVVTSATVERVSFDGSKAVGVEVQVGGKSQRIQLAEGGEVLLTGGSINSPQLLMLSGIGPKAHLEAHGIKTLVDAPGVGKNLQDHPAAVVSYNTVAEHKGISVTSKIRIKGTKITNPRVLLQWKLFGKGPFTSTGCDHGGFFKTKEDLESPDLQMRFLAARALSPDGMGTFSQFRTSTEQLDGFSFQSIVSRPHSRGSVELKSSDPLAHPVIKTGYFSDETAADIATMREGVKLSRKLAQTDAFRQYIGEEVYPGKDVQSDAQIDEYIRSSVHTSNALVGTCRIGKAGDASAVVGPDLKVIGVTNLRVIDASVMPKIPGGQTSAPTIMIAEKAADLMLA
ncbi:GMC oxidoreductase-domain-containing protein, partial [Ochromonadaceae sp. CCMP2298]